MAKTALRPDRAFIRAAGEEVRPFLQGLLSQDVEKVRSDRAVYGALLTPQGKFLHDLFVTEDAEGALVLECEADRADDLLTRLKRYRLRAKVTLELLDGWAAAIVWDGPAFGLGEERGEAAPAGEALAYVDPRLADLGVRVVGPAEAVAAAVSSFDTAPLELHRLLRLSLGVAEGAADIGLDRGYLLESGFDELDGVDWKKGCYVGQELTARTKYRGLVKRRLMPVRIEGAPPEPGDALAFDGRDAGEFRAAGDAETGLALVRLDAWRAAKERNAPLEAGEARLRPAKPDWARFD